MADYTPIFEPGEAITLTTSATVTGGQVLEVSGVSTVAPTSASSAKVLGVAAFDAANGAKVTILGDGVHELTASGTVTAGDQVVSAAAGAVASLAAAAGAAAGDINNARSVIGVALTTATNGNKVQVKVRL